MNERAANIIAHLRCIQRRIDDDNSIRLLERPYSENFDLPSADEHEAQWAIQDSTALIQELEEILTNTEFAEIAAKQTTTDAPWSFGTILQPAGLRPIWLGVVQPVRNVPIVRNVPDIVVAFCLKAIPDHDQFLGREQHGGIGWHYHYMIDQWTRTDTVLCWDTRCNEPPAPPPKIAWIRPLFQELHGEGKAKALGRPDRWKSRKKESMYRACAPDLLKWPITEFRCASNEARPVWPENAVLTPRAGPPNAVQNAPTKRRGRR